MDQRSIGCAHEWPSVHQASQLLNVGFAQLTRQIFGWLPQLLPHPLHLAFDFVENFKSCPAYLWLFAQNVRQSPRVHFPLILQG
jgi:hypothetical protein